MLLRSVSSTVGFQPSNYSLTLDHRLIAFLVRLQNLLRVEAATIIVKQFVGSPCLHVLQSVATNETSFCFALQLISSKLVAPGMNREIFPKSMFDSLFYLYMKVPAVSYYDKAIERLSTKSRNFVEQKLIL